MSDTSMTVKFWGVRGSIAAPGANTLRYGGNTPCVEVRCGGRLLIFDAGTGLRPLGRSLMGGPRVDADIFLSHCHFDHICGLPFFAPCYAAGNGLRLWAGNLLPDFTLAQVIGQMMARPLFPIGYEVFKADVAFRDFTAGEVLTPQPGMTVRTIALNHPHGATGYRLECEGRAVAYVTDNEPSDDAANERLTAFLKGVDLLIYDCTYTEAEFRQHVGWGHSSWPYGVKLAAAAGAKTFCLFHHDPDHDDEALDRIAAEADAMRAGTLVAREGLTLSF